MLPVLLEATVWERLMGGSMLVSIPVALLAGAVSFFSPCVLPLLPGYLSWATGLSSAEVQEGNRRGHVLLGSLLFVAGFTFVFVGIGSFVGTVGAALVDHQRAITVVMGLLTILTGLAFAGLLPLGQRDLRIHRVPRLGLVSAPLLGVVFGLGWTPCMGPALMAVISLVANESTADRGALLSLFYSLGVGIPFVLAGLAVERMTRTIGFVRRHQGAVQRAGGALLVLVGLLLATGVWNHLVSGLQVLASQVQTPI